MYYANEKNNQKKWQNAIKIKKTIASSALFYRNMKKHREKVAFFMKKQAF